MEGKKISFGFKKTKKADKLIPDNNDDKKDYIECVEEQSIKIVGGDTLASNEPLVIPMKPNSLMKPDRLREIALKVEGALEEPSIKIEPMEDGSATDPLAENETLEQMAVRELMQDSKKELKIENPVIAIPTSTKGIADGETESTLDDYDAVPVQEFGVAMLRGMGWTPGQASSNYKQPELRPKGLGLGADKVIKAKPDASKDSKQEELLILKNSYVKIVCGKYSDYYGKVVSLDEDNGRVMVEIPLKKETVSLSEFMMHAVTKSEYDKESKVIRKHKGSHMSVDKKQEIIELYEKKVPVRNIARQLNVARNTVYLWIKRWEENGDLNAHIPSGRPRKLSADEEALLIKQVGQTAQRNVSDLTANHAEKKQGETLEQNINITGTVDLKIDLKEIDSKQSEDHDHKAIPVKDKREQIMTLYEQNHTIAEIARRLNIAKKAVHLCIKCSKFQRTGKGGDRTKLNQKKLTGQQKHQSYVNLDDGTSIATSTSAITKQCKENRQVKGSSTELHEISVVKEKKEKNVDEKLLKLNTRLSEVQKEEIIALYKLKHPIADIAEHLKIARYAADLWIKRWKRESTNKQQISFGRPPKLSADDKAILLKEAAKQAEKISLSDLANNYSVSKATIRRYLRHNGIPFKHSRQTVIKGIPEETTCTNTLEENEERSKTKNDHISVDKKIQILNLYEQKHTISAIARHLKVSKNTVRLWIRRWQAEGTIEPHLPSGRPRKLTSDAEAVLKDQILEGGPLRMTNLASRHGVSTTTIRRCLRENGLNTKLQQREREREEKNDRSVKHGFQDLYCNTIVTELDKELGLLQHKYPVTKTVCDHGISLNKDSDLGRNPIGTRAVCDLGTSQESGQNLCSNTVVANGMSDSDQACTIEIKIENSESYEEYKRKELSQKSSRQEDKKTSYLRQDGKDRGRKEEKENDGRDEKERRHDKVKDRKDEKERDRRDEKDRRDDREREKGPEKELGKRPDRVQESRDEKQTESRDDKESERKDRQGKNNDSRRRRDQESGNGKSKNRQKRDSSSSEDRSSRKKKSKKRHDSSDSLSSLSDDDKKQYKHSKNKSRRRSRSKSDSCVRSTTPEAKRDIDKKRKGKKKKRDRDRSPNYKKHRK